MSTEKQNPTVTPQELIAAVRQMVDAHINQLYKFTPDKARVAATNAVIEEIGDVIKCVVTQELLAIHSFELRRPGRRKKSDLVTLAAASEKA